MGPTDAAKTVDEGVTQTDTTIPRSGYSQTEVGGFANTYNNTKNYYKTDNKGNWMEYKFKDTFPVKGFRSTATSKHKSRAKANHRKSR